MTPGFVDIHTHLDAQIAWDPIATSSCWHGVTSIVLGNCGVSFAPCRPQDRPYLAEMMESVEDIPSEAIMAGVPWDWVTFGDYLDWLERSPKGVNVGGMVGHCAVRYHVMGERSLDEDQPPTEDDLDDMVAAVDEAMAAGALGFSTSRTLRHKVPDGRQVPGTWADAGELIAIAEILDERGRGVVEVSPRFDGDGPSLPRAMSEMEWMRHLSIKTGRPVTFNLTHTFENPDHHRAILEMVHDANHAGARIRPQTTARGVGVLFTLDGMTPFDAAQSWQTLKPLSLPEKLAALRVPERRAELVAEAADGPDADRLAHFFVMTGEDGPATTAAPRTPCPR